MSLSVPRDSTRDGPIAEIVVETVASVEGVPPTSLTPLYEFVDPDALESLFQPGTTGRIEFTYEGYDVVVDARGRVTVGPGE